MRKSHDPRCRFFAWSFPMPTNIVYFPTIKVILQISRRVSLAFNVALLHRNEFSIWQAVMFLFLP